MSDKLNNGTRTALARYRTLRATMDWSYGLLSHRGARMAAALDAR